MKDAYSFHTSQADLEDYYAKCHEAYQRIYARVGLPEVISVASDSGMMGGSIFHGFMLLTPIGEDSIVICKECDYRDNMEAAERDVEGAEYYDDCGPIWPLSVAPWQVHLCAVRSDDAEVKAYADKLYDKLWRKGVEVIYDDRKVSAGVMFSDADLIGVPYRVIVSPRNIKQNVVEIVSRDKRLSINASMESAAEEVLGILREVERIENTGLSEGN